MNINKMSQTNYLIVIIGPTGIGKTDLSLELAQKYNTEILSCDSRQFYKEIPIGTAAPTADETSRIKHHFIGNISVKDYYNASMFEEQAIEVLDNIYKTNNVAIMVGGSGMYIDAVCGGIDSMPDIDTEIRNNLQEKYEKEGIESLRFDLKKLDPIHYQKVDLKNYKRILRALEVCVQTGKPYSSYHTNTKKNRNFKVVKIGLSLEREILYNRINKRVEIMIEQGLETEARANYQYKDLNSLNTVGYKEMFKYFDGIFTKEQAINYIKQNSRHYAKRQISWFKRYDDINWFNKSEEEEVYSFLDERLD